MIIRKSVDEIAVMRRAGKITAEAFEVAEKAIRPGRTTAELDKLIESLIREQGAIPAFKGYLPPGEIGQGFPASACISVNEGVVHGIPGERRLEEGDIVSIDVGVLKDGYFADQAKTFGVGEISQEAARLIGTAERALYAGIEECRVGHHLYDISFAIQTVAEKERFSVVRDFVGHGIGQAMHEAPQIPNHGEKGKGVVLKQGMVFALEPMVNQGGWEVEVLDDRWTVITKDRSLSAHFEHTVAIADNGPQIVTAL